MDKLPTPPKTLLEAVRYFADPDACLAFMVEIRWNGNVVCPTCGRPGARFLSARRVWQCASVHPKRQFSAKTGTIFEDSPLGMEKWLPAVWLIVNAKNGISSYEVHRALGVTQKTAWFMLHRIRLAMQDQSLEKLRGQVEADETYIGGKVRFMHRDRRERVMQGQKAGKVSKTAVMGLLERGGRVRAKVLSRVANPEMRDTINANVEPGTEMITDAATPYKTLSPTFVHSFVDHVQTYVKGYIHTNGIESFWSMLKRTLRGSYISVEPFHLHRYVDEQAFRYNERQHPEGDGGRFVTALRTVLGRRLTYAQLTGSPT